MTYTKCVKPPKAQAALCDCHIRSVCHRDPGWGVEQKEIITVNSLLHYCVLIFMFSLSETQTIAELMLRDLKQIWLNLSTCMRYIFCVCMHAYAHVCMHVWRSEIDFKYCSLRSCFWDMVLVFEICLSLAWNTPSRLVWLTSKFQGSACLASLVLGLQMGLPHLVTLLAGLSPQPWHILFSTF